MAPNFTSILDKPASEIERPKPMPQGSYSTVVVGMPTHGESNKKKTPFVEFTLRITGAMDDVDQAELEAYGDISNKTVKATFYVTDDSVFRLKDFLGHCGIDMEGRSLREALDDTPNCEVGAYIQHEPSQDGESIFARFKSSFALD